MWTVVPHPYLCPLPPFIHPSNVYDLILTRLTQPWPHSLMPLVAEGKEIYQLTHTTHHTQTRSWCSAHLSYCWWWLCKTRSWNSSLGRMLSHCDLNHYAKGIEENFEHLVKHYLALVDLGASLKTHFLVSMWQVFAVAWLLVLCHVNTCRCLIVLKEWGLLCAHMWVCSSSHRWATPILEEINLQHQLLKVIWQLSTHKHLIKVCLHELESQFHALVALLWCHSYFTFVNCKTLLLHTSNRDLVGGWPQFSIFLINKSLLDH